MLVFLFQLSLTFAVFVMMLYLVLRLGCRYVVGMCSTL